MTFNTADLTSILPELVLTAGALLILIFEMLIISRERALQFLALGVSAAAAVMALVSTTSSAGAFNGMVGSGGFEQFIKLLISGVVFLTILLSGDYFRGSDIRHGEYYSLMLIAAVGMMVLATSTDLITLFIGLETMSIALYVMAAIQPWRERSTEGALKYLVLGAFSSAFLLYGIALIYGTTGGKTNFAAIQTSISQLLSQGDPPSWLLAGVGLLLVGLLFKVAAVPFHFWSPDAYQGAPTPVTAFMSTGPKAAAIAVFVRLFGWGLPDVSSIWIPALTVIAAATMIYANLVALNQRDIKRMLAYSSISHAGYLLVGVIASGNGAVREDAAAGLFFYLAAYYLMNMGAFVLAIMVNRAQSQGDYQIDDYRGLASRHPILASAMALFLISLTGIPPTAGFFGKFYLFSAAVNAGHITIVVIAVLMSVISAFYYLRPVVYMFMTPSQREAKVSTNAAWMSVIIICALGILKFGLLPGDLMKWAGDSSYGMKLPASITISIK